MSFAPHRSGKRGEAVKSLRPPTPILGALEYRVANKIRDHMKAVHFRQTDIFHRFDRDGSGKLDARELRSALAEIGLKLTLTEIKAFDFDGTITIDEFLKYMKLTRTGVLSPPPNPASTVAAPAPPFSPAATSMEYSGLVDTIAGSELEDAEAWTLPFQFTPSPALASPEAAPRRPSPSNPFTPQPHAATSSPGVIAMTRKSQLSPASPKLAKDGVQDVAARMGRIRKELAAALRQPSPTAVEPKLLRYQSRGFASLDSTTAPSIEPNSRSVSPATASGSQGELQAAIRHLRVELREEKKRRKMAEEAASDRLMAKQQVAESRETIEKLQERNRTSRREADDCRSRLTELNAQHQNVVKERDRAVAECTTLRKSVAEAESDKRRQTRAMQRRAAEFNSSRQQLEGRVKQAQESALKFQRQASTARAEVQGIETRLQQALKRTEAIEQAQDQQISAATSQLKQQLVVARKQAEQHQFELQEQASSLQTEQERADQVAAALEQSRMEHEEESSGMKLTYDELTIELNRLRVEHAETELLVQSAVERMRAAEAETAASWTREQAAAEKAASLELVLEQQRADFFAAEIQANTAEKESDYAAKTSDEQMDEISRSLMVLEHRSAALDQRELQLQEQEAMLQEKRDHLAATSQKHHEGQSTMEPAKKKREGWMMQAPDLASAELLVARFPDELLDGAESAPESAQNAQGDQLAATADEEAAVVRSIEELLTLAIELVEPFVGSEEMLTALDVQASLQQLLASGAPEGLGASMLPALCRAVAPLLDILEQSLERQDEDMMKGMGDPPSMRAPSPSLFLKDERAASSLQIQKESPIGNDSEWLFSSRETDYAAPTAEELAALADVQPSPSRPKAKRHSGTSPRDAIVTVLQSRADGAVIDKAPRPTQQRPSIVASMGWGALVALVLSIIVYMVWGFVVDIVFSTFHGANIGTSPHGVPDVRTERLASQAWRDELLPTRRTDGAPRTKALG